MHRTFGTLKSEVLSHKVYVLQALFLHKMDFNALCNTKISLKFHANTICANLVTCRPTTDANIRRHLVAIFGTTIRLKIDINVLTIYINIKAGDRGKYCLTIIIKMAVPIIRLSFQILKIKYL